MGVTIVPIQRDGFLSVPRLGGSAATPLLNDVCKFQFALAKDCGLMGYRAQFLLALA
jgi:hypothetical protein